MRYREYIYLLSFPHHPHSKGVELEASTHDWHVFVGTQPAPHIKNAYLVIILCAIYIKWMYVGSTVKLHTDYISLFESCMWY